MFWLRRRIICKSNKRLCPRLKVQKMGQTQARDILWVIKGTWLIIWGNKSRIRSDSTQSNKWTAEWSWLRRSCWSVSFLCSLSTRLPTWANSWLLRILRSQALRLWSLQAGLRVNKLPSPRTLLSRKLVRTCNIWRTKLWHVTKREKNWSNAGHLKATSMLWKTVLQSWMKLHRNSALSWLVISVTHALNVYK